MAGPHDGQPVLAAGEPIDRAEAVIVLVHGRGARAEDIVYDAAPLLEVPGVAFLAPAAAANTWYPYPFTAPMELNEPWLSSALEFLGRVYAQASGQVPAERVGLLGFSQGACLALEYAARNARRYGALVGWSGGLIGPDDTPRDYPGSLDGTPVFLGCSDPDPHIPTERVRLTAEVLTRLGGEVDMRLYPGMGHTVNADEIARTRELIEALTRRKEEVK
jgi:predicted esterase